MTAAPRDLATGGLEQGAGLQLTAYRVLGVPPLAIVPARHLPLLEFLP